MSELKRLIDIINTLRGPDGCPWDKEQTPVSMRPYLLEETYEVLDAIDGGDPAQLTEELGDLLFNVLMIAQMGGPSAIDDVARGIADKMIERHPHVFGDEDHKEAGTIDAWERRKTSRTRGRLAGVPRSLPGLLRAHRQGEKAASVGFDWQGPMDVLDKISEELGELVEAMQADDHSAIEHELGDLLMAVANLGRKLKIPPESAMQTANNRFRQRFEAMEAMARDADQLLHDLDDAALDALWESAKAQ